MKRPLFPQFKKMILMAITAVTILMLGGINNLVFANANILKSSDTTKKILLAVDPLPDLKFNVKKYLTIESDQPGVTGQQNQSYLESNNPAASFILQIINFIALTVGSLCFALIVYGGFLMMSSAGQANQVNKGKDIITHAIVGLVLTLSAYFIIAFVQSILFETI